jgi:hypothetical protein
MVIKGEVLTLSAIACIRSFCVCLLCRQGRHLYTAYTGTRRRTVYSVSWTEGLILISVGTTIPEKGAHIALTLVFFIRHRSHAFHTRL